MRSGTEQHDYLFFPLCFQIKDEIENGLYIDIALKNQEEARVLHCRMEIIREAIYVKKGDILELTYRVKQPHLAPGDYTLEVYIFDRHRHVFLWVENIPFLHIDSMNHFGITKTYGQLQAPIIPPFGVEVTVK